MISQIRKVLMSLNSSDKAAMAFAHNSSRPAARTAAAVVFRLALSASVLFLAACATSGAGRPSSMNGMSASRDPRIGLRAGLMDAAEAVWNMRVLSKTPPSEKFLGQT
ncbi:MAG: hypothetical protein ABIM89_06365, partial [Mycobacteriales bacterium]